MGMCFSRTVLLVILAVLPAMPQNSMITYSLHREANPTADQLDAYARITIAMDSAVKMYNTHTTTLSKHINVYYNTTVGTADGNFNGTVRFGSGRAYMVVATAMHEISHTLGIGTTPEYRNLIVNGNYTGARGTAMLRTISGDPQAVLRGDLQHFWPHGLNQASEGRTVQDLINHCRMVEAIIGDLFFEELYFVGRVRQHSSGQCMVRTGNNLSLGNCSEAGAQIRIVSLGQSATEFRMHFGDRVLDSPNESTAAGLVMSLFGWNGGRHQRFAIEQQSGALQNTVRLRMIHSGHYLRASGSQVLQDRASVEINNQYWELISGDNPVPLVNNSTMPLKTIRITGQYDLLGRFR